MAINDLNDIGSLRCWYDFGDASTVDVDGSNNVTEVRDKSTVIQGPAAANVLDSKNGTVKHGIRLINNKTVLDCQTGGVYSTTAFTTAIAQPLTMLFAGVQDAAGTQVFMGGVSSTLCQLFVSLSPAGALSVNAPSFPPANMRIPPGHFFILLVTLDQFNHKVYLNGVSRYEPGSTCGANALDGVSLGRNYAGANLFDGAIAEAAVFNAALTDSEVVDVVNYIREKWAPWGPITSVEDITNAPNIRAELGIGGASTAAELGDIASDINTIGKATGKPRFDSTSGQPVYATGAAAGDAWNYFDGTEAYAPA